MRCPSCGEPNPDGARWCEACGTDLTVRPDAVCVACGLANIEDGYCLSCGYKQPVPRDHVVVAVGSVAAVSDRGLRHHHNEDAVAVADVGAGGAALVVCDGVSSTPGSDVVSEAAANAARDELVAQLLGVNEPDAEAIDKALNKAVVAAQSSAMSSAVASSTLVVAVAHPTAEGHHVMVAWLGDSRAYWLGRNGAVLLTEDHELGGRLVRWIGADGDGQPAEVRHRLVTDDGLLVVCSDGLWRYAPEAGDMAAAVRGLGGPTAPLDGLGEGLVQLALDGGGHDNISVALWATAASDSRGAVGPDELADRSNP
ncbi:MAG: protein phosphatase 2C domain-containing protein [Actinomycetota bacterium]